MEEKIKKSNKCSNCNLVNEIPKIPMYGPYNMRGLDPNKTYYWCSCGLSKNQPFCDNSHISTKFKPIPFKPPKQSFFSICGCKYTKSPPFCDGTHGPLPFDPQFPPCGCNQKTDIEDLINCIKEKKYLLKK